MTALAAPCNATSQSILVDTPEADPTYPFFRSLDSETIKVVGNATANTWQVERGVGDTQATTHLAGTVLVADASPYGAAEGGGGVTVDNTVDAPVAVTSIVAAGATFDGAEATLGGLTNPLLVPLSITSDEPSVLEITGGPIANAEDLVAINASDGDILYINTTGQGNWSLLEEGVAFKFRRASGALIGDILKIDEYGVEIPGAAYFGRDGGGTIGFFGASVAQPAAIADATDAPSTMARLNDLLAALRLLGLIDT